MCDVNNSRFSKHLQLLPHSTSVLCCPLALDSWSVFICLWRLWMCSLFSSFIHTETDRELKSRLNRFPTAFRSRSQNQEDYGHQASGLYSVISLSTWAGLWKLFRTPCSRLDWCGASRRSCVLVQVSERQSVSVMHDGELYYSLAAVHLFTQQVIYFPLSCYHSLKVGHWWESLFVCYAFMRIINK